VDEVTSEHAAVVLLWLSDWVFRSIDYWWQQMDTLSLWAQSNQFKADIITVNLLIVMLIVAVRLDQRRRRANLMKRLGLGMAKWKKGHLADVVNEAINNAEGFSRQEKRAITILIAGALGLDDLLPRKWNRKAIAHRVKKNCEAMGKALALSNPKVPGGIAKSGEVPEFKDLGSSFLAKRRKAA
jgi:hypothetical protein